MQGTRITVLIAFVVLQVFIGCKTSRQEASPPAAVPSHSADIPAATNNHSTVTLSLGANKEVSRQVIGPNTVVQWRYDKKGYKVHFKESSPCVVRGDIPLTLEKNAKKSGEPYVAQCTIRPDVPKGTTFEYQIEPIKPGLPLFSVGHCKGCILETTTP